MKLDNYLNFRPLFYSEISSTYILYEVLCYDQVTGSLINTVLHKNFQSPVRVHRKYRLSDAGNVDILIECTINGNPSVVLIEGKVHDYLSAASHQIIRYYTAAGELFPEKDIFFIYLTQFNSSSLKKIRGISIPPTIQEFNHSLQNIRTQERLFHVTWENLHSLFSDYSYQFTDELKHMLTLQKGWIEAKTVADLKERTVELGARDIHSFLTDIDFSLAEELPFGVKKVSGKREVFEIDLHKCTNDEILKTQEVYYCLSMEAETERFLS